MISVARQSCSREHNLALKSRSKSGGWIGENVPLAANIRRRRRRTDVGSPPFAGATFRLPRSEVAFTLGGCERIYASSTKSMPSNERLIARSALIAVVPMNWLTSRPGPLRLGDPGEGGRSIRMPRREVEQPWSTRADSCVLTVSRPTRARRPSIRSRPSASHR